jgi:hypothetical protein
MKYFVLLLSLSLLSSCQTTSDYQPGSVAEARAYGQRAVEKGYIHKGGEAGLIAQKSAGKPLEGTWNPQKMDQFFNNYAAEHPRLVEINLAATKGTMSEADRVFYTTVAVNQETRIAEQKAAQFKEASADLNQAAAQNAQGSSFRQNSALMQSTPTSSYSGYGTGFGGRAY